MYGQVGKMLTGDVIGQAFLWLPREGGWDVQKLFKNKANKSNKGNKTNDKMPSTTIEELQWKPLEEGRGEIFAAGSNDGSIK